MATKPELFAETLTEDYYDYTNPATVDEDKEATTLGVDWFAEAIEQRLELKRLQGWRGWNRKTECPVARLVDMFESAVKEGDLVKVGAFAMMLHARGVTNLYEPKIKKEASDLSHKISQILNLEAEVQNSAALTGDVMRDVNYSLAALINQYDTRRQEILKQLK